MPPRILTVDDANAVRTLAKQVLQPFNCDVQEATNGYNALFVMEKALPDLVLLDVSMPIMGGIELLELMRANDILKPIRVLMLTSPADHASLHKITELGVSGILRKPFKPEDLLALIRALVPLTPA